MQLCGVCMAELERVFLFACTQIEMPDPIIFVTNENKIMTTKIMSAN